jgi:2-methylfumaryl-CoA hydratase
MSQSTMSNKTNPGNFFEDFQLGEEIVHPTPRTLSAGDVSLYTALYGTRFALHSSAEFAVSMGLPASPVDDFLTFNLVFGKTVPDISQNAIANLGYAAGRFGVPLYCGDTIRARSTVIGLKENKDRQNGVVWVRSVGLNHRGEMVVDYCRWVMVRKRDTSSPAPEPVVPALPQAVDPSELVVPEGLRMSGYEPAFSGSRHFWDDYQLGEKIDHRDGMTIEEAEHMMATRLFQNTARAHFNQHLEKDERFGRRIVYGGHIISLARSLSFNGLANAFRVAAINAGRHVAPTLAGDTVYAWSEVLAKFPVAGHSNLGALRLRTVATKDRACVDFPYKTADGRYDPSVVLDLEYDVLMPAPG